MRPRNDPGQYDDLVAEWWKPRGAFEMLHWIAAARAALVPTATRPGAMLLDIGCGASTPPPHPISSSIAPGRVAVGTRAARPAAIQCSISNAPRGFHHSATRSSYWPGSLRGRTSWHGRRSLRGRMTVAAPADTAHLRSLLAGRRPTALAAPGQAARRASCG